MTQYEIKKALEICTDIYAPCNGCPYEICTNCDNTLHTDALNVIIEQENEIERLRTTLGQCSTELNSALESLKSQCREIGELRAKVKQAQIDILNKLKERIKTAIDTYFNLDGGGYYLAEGAIDDIDGLVEEVENEN